MPGFVTTHAIRQINFSIRHKNIEALVFQLPIVPDEINKKLAIFTRSFLGILRDEKFILQLFFQGPTTNRLILTLFAKRRR